VNALSQFLAAHQLPCPFRQHLHIPCPGCGFQSSLIALLDGHLATSANLYPALIPLLCLWLFVALHLIFTFRQGAFIIKTLFLICAFIIVISYTNTIIALRLFS